MARLYCVARNCEMRTWNITSEHKFLDLNKYSVSYHKFPIDVSYRKLWKEALGKENWEPKNDSVVCSLHFSGDCYDENNKLLGNAVPSIFFENFGAHLKPILERVAKENKNHILDSDDGPKDTVEDAQITKEFSQSGLSDDDFEIECEEIIETDEESNPSSTPTRNMSPVIESKFETKPDLSPEKLSPKKSSTKLSPTKPEKKLPLTQKSPVKPSPAKTVVKPSYTQWPIKFSFNKVLSKPTTTKTFVSKPSLAGASIKSSTVEAATDKSAPVVAASKPCVTTKALANKTAAKSSFSNASLKLLSNDFGSKNTAASAVAPASTTVTTSASAFTSSSNSSSSKPTRPVIAIPKLHNIPTNENTSDEARQLHSMIQSGSFHNFSVMEPASKNLVRQLLDIVKLANSGNPTASSGVDDSVPNTYIITTKYDDPKACAKVRSVETNEVISMVTQTVQSIKDGTYERRDDLVIICGSPAIFLIKNVSVKSFDPNMNSVYVITSENLISYLYLLSTQVKPARKTVAKTMTATTPTSSRPVQSLTVTTSAAVVSTKRSATSTVAQTVSVTSSSSATPKVASHVQPSAFSKTTTQQILSGLAAKNASLIPLKGGSEITPSSGSASLIPATSIAHPRVGTPSQVPVVDATPKNSSLLASGASTPTSTSNAARIQAALRSSIVIPSKSSAFQTPNTIVTPSGAVARPIVVTSGNALVAARKPILPFSVPLVARAAATSITAPSKLPTSSSMILARLSSTSKFVALPRTANANLAQSVPSTVKLNVTRPVAVCAPKTSSLLPLKPIQVGQKTLQIRPMTAADAIRFNLKFDSSSPATKRKASDAPANDSCPKRGGGVGAGDVENVAIHDFEPEMLFGGSMSPTDNDASVVTSETAAGKSGASSGQRGFGAVKRKADQPLEANDQFQPKVLLSDCCSPNKKTASAVAPPPPPSKTKVTSSFAGWPVTPTTTTTNVGVMRVDGQANGVEDERPLSPRRAQQLLADQRLQIRSLEETIIRTEREILELKKRLLGVKNPADAKSDEQLVEEILRKYLDNDAVQFFCGQMKVAGKTFTQYRWTEDDKLFALGLLYRNPVEYNVLMRRFTLPSDKTLNKFVARIKRAETEPKN